MPSSTNPNRFDEDMAKLGYRIGPPRYAHLIAEYSKTPGGFPNRINFTDWLDQHSRDGWRLVSVVTLHSSLYECFFVRPVTE